MSAISIFHQVEFKTTTCCQCGVTIALVTTLWDQRHRDHQNFWCPNGHTQHWPGKSTEEQLREQLAAERAELARRRADIDSKDRAIAALKGQAKRQKTRIAAGICPCCNRTFAALAQHMTKKHPDWKAQDIG